jgi:hypothetical protein
MCEQWAEPISNNPTAGVRCLPHRSPSPGGLCLEPFRSGLHLRDNSCPHTQKNLGLRNAPGANPDVLNFPQTCPPRNSERSTRSLKLSKTSQTWLPLSSVGHTLAAWRDQILTSTLAFTIARHPRFRWLRCDLSQRGYAQLDRSRLSRARMSGDCG